MSHTIFYHRVLRRMVQAACLIAGLSLLVGCVATMPTVQAPSDQRQLTREVQTMLAAKGFNAGPADGIAGNKTYGLPRFGVQHAGRC